jgi:neurofibromin 1
MTNLMRHQDHRVRRAAVDCLTQLHNPSIIVHWGPSETIMANFWKISCQVVLSIARQILDISRQTEPYMKILLDLLANILDARTIFLTDISVNKVVWHLYVFSAELNLFIGNGHY